MSAGLGLALHLAVLVGAHWYMDLIMGVVHMCLDSPGVLHLPAMGTFTTTFQYHHTRLSYDAVPFSRFLLQYGVEVLSFLQITPLLVVLGVFGVCRRRRRDRQRQGLAVC